MIYANKIIVKTDKSLYRILEVEALEGDSKKAQKKLGWKAKIVFNDLIKIMMDADLERWKKWKNGEVFPWDVSGSIDEYDTLKRTKK